jgi:predicted RND superfamily exporter protein
MLIDGIQDVLAEKRKVDKKHTELTNKMEGKNQDADSTKMKEKDEQRKMRIRLETDVSNLKSHGVILMSRIGNEEARSKVYLEEKLKLEQEFTDMK